ncbi:hypothetical protein, partial [Methanoregula sp. PtaU1.Bin006]|uniref:hypothetical protein n=1 Tax=Methanoregula sp. PtaU1.Bin006 TaxID=1811681 RepID=UPI0025D35D12
NSWLFKGFSEPASYMGAFCHTSVRHPVDFTAPKCKARPKILKNEKALIKIVVGRFWEIRGAAK